MSRFNTFLHRSGDRLATLLFLGAAIVVVTRGLANPGALWIGPPREWCRRPPVCSC
jgi:hypothetical protein